MFKIKKRFKSYISLMMSLVIVLCAIVQIPVTAAKDAAFEKAISMVKEKIVIPEEFNEVNYSLNEYLGRKNWNIEWYNKDRNKGGLNASVDETGLILSYSKYRNVDYSGKMKLPKYDVKESIEIAKAFFEKINGRVYSNFIIAPDSTPQSGSNIINVPFVRVQNNITYSSNNAQVTVNRDTGEVDSFYMTWNEKLVFPDASKVLSIENARIAFAKNIELQLQYSSAYDAEKETIAPVFAFSPQGNSAIDAITGDKLPSNIYYPNRVYAQSAVGGMANGARYLKMDVEKAAYDVKMTPEETSAIEKAGNLISSEEAQKYLRELNFLGLTQEYNLENAYLNKNWSSANGYLWNLSFTNVPMQTPSDMKNRKSISISMDAETKEVTGFYASSDNYEAKKPGSISREDAKLLVEEFAKKLAPEKFSSCREYLLNENSLKEDLSTQSIYNFRYVRVVNNVCHYDNFIEIAFDSNSGKINSYSSNWSKQEYPSVEKTITSQIAFEKFFKETDIEIQYYDTFSQSMISSVMPPAQGEQNPEIKLGYFPKSGNFARIDALTGEMLGYDNKAIKKIKTVKYSDIQNNYAKKQIEALADFGIYFENDEFKPEEKITQKDFVFLISKTIDNGIMYESMNRKIEADRVYQNIIASKIILESEKNPDKLLTREECIKFIVRALKYDKVADIGGIFKYPFNDSDAGNQTLLGYTTIAHGLGIINGYDDGSFKPNNTLTRAEAMVVLYNYMSI